MGEVYKALDTRLDRTVAIKTLPAHVAGDPELRQRFEREAKALAALSHPHICSVFDLGSQDDIDFLVMEYLEGETMAARLSMGALAQDQMLQAALEIADALDTAHGKGIVHRDLKPGNIVLTASGAKLLDFGLAKRRVESWSTDPDTPTELSPADRTVPGAVLGTIAYMAPEQARGDDVDARADLFSFGVVLHEMATGARPPAGVDRLHPALARIIGKALEQSPELRYQSAAEMRSDLLRLRRDSGRDARGPRTAARTPSARKRIASLAVLPLGSAGDDADSAYLGEGIAEALINGLSQMGRLRVTPPQKSFRYTGDDQDLQRVGRELQVQSLVTGRVVVRGDTLVVKLNLVDIERDAQLWGQQFTAKMSDIFTLQDDIVEQVLGALRVKLTGARTRKATRAQPNTEVYHLYLKGRYHSAKRTPPNTQRALELYQQVLDLDPTYAPAYAGVADCYCLLGFTPYGTMKPADAFPRARAAAERALALDPSLGDAYASLGNCAHFYDWDWDAAIENYRKCLRLAPESLGVRIWYPVLLVQMGRHDEAIAEAETLRRIDPLSASAATIHGQVLYFTRRFDEAEHACRQALELDPGFVTALVFVGLVHLTRREYDEAVSMMSQALSLAPHHQQLGLMGLACGLAGREAEALDMLERLTDLSRRSYVSPHSLAEAYAGLGRVEEWRAMMAAALEERSGLLVHLDAAWWDSLRDDPFLAEIRRQVGPPDRP
jgi:TolB-like protein/Flp pilus assembly protein TadD